MEDEVIDTERLLRALVQRSSDATCVVSADGRIVFASGAILGYSAEELTERRAMELVHPAERSTLLRRAVEGEHTGCYRLLHRDGEFRFVECRVSSHLDDPGVQSLIITIRDVPTLANVPDDAPERYRLVAEYARDLILVLDTNGHILWASPSHRMLLGRDPKDLIGIHCGTYIHPDDRQKQRDTLRQRVSDRVWRSTELRLEHIDGRWVDVESLGVPIVRPNGSVEKVVVIARDITDRIAMERRLREGEKRLRLVLQQMPANVWTTDRDLVVTSSQGGGLASVGLMPDQLVGVSLAEYFRDDARLERVIALHLRALAGERFQHEATWAGRDLLVSMQPLRNDDDEIVGTLGISFDVTQQRLAERRYQSLFARNLAGVFRSTPTGRLLECNEAFARIFGYASADEMRGTSTRDLYFTEADRQEIVNILTDSGELVNFERRLRRRDGTPVWTLLNETLVHDETSGEDVFEGTIIDITARKVAEARMEYQAFHDSLTDLPNRFLFNDRLNLALAQARRHGRSLAVMFLDLDHFKLINDTMAHTAGDELLRTVAARLTASLRSDDTVARIGGDEFVFILPDVEQAAGAAKAAQKVLDAVRRPVTVHDRELYITASIGIAIAPHDGDDTDTLVKNADSAMYRAKELGRNTYQFHTPITQQRAEVRLTLESALRRALDRDEFVLYYQPQVELATGRITRFEALIRWQRPGVGLVEPKDFIWLAEEIGSIVPMGDWVLREACAQLREWRQQGFDHLGISVNLSPRQFQYEHLTHMVETAIDDTEIDPRCLELEITESLSMRDSDLTVGRLTHFRALGIRVSLDDFGSGYSSLSHLRMLPIDTVKIDRSFIVGLAEDTPERTIVQAIVTMANALRLRVVAEGVETETQLGILRALGCDEVQGYIFSRPLPAEQALQLLKARNG